MKNVKLTAAAVSSSLSRASIPRSRGPGDRRFVVELWDADEARWRTLDSSHRGHSRQQVQAELAHIRDMPAHEIRVTEVRHPPARRGAGSGAKRNAHGPARRYTMAQVRAANEERSKRRGLQFSFFDKNTSRFFSESKYSGPYSGAGGVFFVAFAVGRTPAIYRFTPGDGSIDFAAHAEGVEAARTLARQLAKGS